MADVYKFKAKLRKFDLETSNCLLKGMVQRMQEAYEDFEDLD